MKTTYWDEYELNHAINWMLGKEAAFALDCIVALGMAAGTVPEEPGDPRVKALIALKHPGPDRDKTINLARIWLLHGSPPANKHKSALHKYYLSEEEARVEAQIEADKWDHTVVVFGVRTVWQKEVGGVVRIHQLVWDSPEGRATYRPVFDGDEDVSRKAYVEIARYHPQK